MASRSLGSLFIDLLMKTGRFETDAGRAARIAERRAKEIERAFGRAFSTVQGNIIGFVGAFVSAQAAWDAFANSINAADRIDELSARLGISTEKLSEWAYAAKLSGTDLEGLAGALPKLAKSIAAAADESSSAAALFKALGVDVKDSAGNLRDVEDVLPEIADRFKTLDSDTTEAALAMELFGKSGAELLEFLNRGSDGLDELGAKARELGVVIDGDTAAAAAGFKDELDILRAAGQGFFTQLSAELLPALTELTQWATGFVKDGGNSADVARTIGNTLEAIGTIAQAIWWPIDKLGDYIEGTTARMVAMYEAGAGILTLDWSRIQNAGQAYRDAFEEPGGQAQASPARAVSESIDFTRPAPADPALAGRINRFFAGGDPKAKRTGKSEEEKQAEALQKAYESLAGQQREQIALFGQTSEEAKVRYETEFGELSKLDALKKEELIRGAQKLDQLRDEAEVQKELDAINARRAKEVQQLLEDLSFEADLLGRTADEQEVLNNLRWAGVDANSEYGRSIIEATEALQRQREAVSTQIETMDALRGAGQEVFDSLREGESVWDSLLDGVEAFADKLFEIATSKILDQLFGKQGDAGGGAWGDAIGSVLGTIFGGGRAVGGPVSGGRMYEVAERGMPEVLTVRNRQMLLMPPNVNGVVAPMRSASNPVNQYNTFAFAAPTSPNTQAQVASRVGFQLRRSQRFGQ